MTNVVEEEIRYEKKKRLGSGRNGVVYLAKLFEPKDLSEHLLAVKEIEIGEDSASHVSRFKEKCLSLLKLAHENIVRYMLASGRPPTELEPAYKVLVMEYCPGRSVFTIIPYSTINQVCSRF